MGLSAGLVNVTANELVYLITNTNNGEFSPPGTSVVISANESVSPDSSDLALDCVNNTWGRAACSALRQICRAGLDGLGGVAAGAWTQAQARDLFSGNGATQYGSPLAPRAELDIQPVSGVAGGPLIEAAINVNGGDGTPEIDITAAAVVGSAILRVRLRSTPGIK